jgi:glutaminase
MLDSCEQKIRVIEVQGALFFGSTERLLRRLDTVAAKSEYLILDLRRVHDADQAAGRLLMEAYDWLATRGRKLYFTHLDAEGRLASLHALVMAHGTAGKAIFIHRDDALEHCENQLIATLAAGKDRSKFSLGALDVFRGLERADLKVIEGLVHSLMFEPGQTIVKEGDEAHLLFIIARGTASVQLKVGEGEHARVVRIAALGPGLSFGEMALIDGGRRSADVVAEDRVVCYGFSVEQLRDLGSTHPKLYGTILGNIMREFSERLRRANDEIRALEQ